MRTCTPGCSKAASPRSSASSPRYDGKMHLGVTIDDDPGQDLMRDTGRYLFFFANEVEVIET